MIFISNNQTPEVLKPGKEPFDFPATLIASEFAAILSAWSLPALAMWRNHFNATFFAKLLIKFVAIVSFITYNFIWSVLGKTFIYRCLNQLHFVRRSAFHVSGDRKTRSVCDGHDLGAFAALCLADSKTPFFAGAKLPSMNASRISIFPRLCRSSANSWTIRRKTPSRTHCWNRRWHVWYGGYRCGRSFQGAPVRKIHNIPFKTLRGSRARRPLGSLGGVNDMIIGSILFHCSFVISILILLHNQVLMSRFFLR